MRRIRFISFECGGGRGEMADWDLGWNMYDKHGIHRWRYSYVVIYLSITHACFVYT